MSPEVTASYTADLHNEAGGVHHRPAAPGMFRLLTAASGLSRLRRVVWGMRRFRQQHGCPRAWLWVESGCRWKLDRQLRPSHPAGSTAGYAFGPHASHNIHAGPNISANHGGDSATDYENGSSMGDPHDHVGDPALAHSAKSHPREHVGPARPGELRLLTAASGLSRWRCAVWAARRLRRHPR